MADVIAERLAAAVGRCTCLQPSEESVGGPIKFDANYYYVQAIRRRPEWVIDPTFYEYLPMQDVAQHRKDGRRCREQRGEQRSRVPLPWTPTNDEPVMLVGAFGRHPDRG